MESSDQDEKFSQNDFISEKVDEVSKLEETKEETAKKSSPEKTSNNVLQ